MHGRVKQRRWHDGRENEPGCKHEFLIATSSDYAKDVLSAERGPWCAECGPPPGCRTPDRAVSVADGRGFAGPFRWPNPWDDVPWQERPPLAAWNDPFAELLDLVNPPLHQGSVSRSPWSARRFELHVVVRALFVDHVVPLIDGGGFGLDNLQLLCAECHGRKTARENRARARSRRAAKSGQMELV